MLRFLPGPLVGILVGLYLAFTTVTTCTLMLVPGLIKRLVARGPVQVWCDAVLGAIASAWVQSNNIWLTVLYGPDWGIQPSPPLNTRGWYLIIANHQSWVDILILQRHFHGRIPFLKFFIKQELIWVPFLGLAWWALDYPFMKRGKGRSAHRSDIEATRAACEKFMRAPTSVINFLEGGRYSPERAQAQASPYRNLLKPHVGGITTTLATMGNRFESILDATLAYPQGTPRFWDLMCGKVSQVGLQVQIFAVPPDFRPRADAIRPINRHAVSDWVDERWLEKDATLSKMLNAEATTHSVSHVPPESP